LEITSSLRSRRDEIHATALLASGGPRKSHAERMGSYLRAQEEEHQERIKVNELLAGLGGIIIASIFSWMYGRISYWRGLYEARQADFEEMTERAFAAEASLAISQQEMEFQRTTLLQLSQREAIAVLTDRQVATLAQTVAELVAAHNNSELLN
jgi:hypothetical protein